jgi:hypothetical protein
MVQYLLSPLHVQYDLGFGVTGDAFKHAADDLDKSEKAARNLFHERLPINYLYRHAIELYLKSGIVIFHKRLNLPFGDSAKSEPKVLVGTKWQAFHHIHSIHLLWAYLKELLTEHATWLKNNASGCDWTAIPPELDSWVQTIHNGDPRSTFFRYPSTTNPKSDAPKSAMKEVTAPQLSEMLENSDPPKKKVFALVVEDDEDNFVKAYVHDDQEESAFGDAVRSAAEFFEGLHAAMRHEICGGS